MGRSDGLIINFKRVDSPPRNRILAREIFKREVSHGLGGLGGVQEGRRGRGRVGNAVALWLCGGSGCDGRAGEREGDGGIGEGEKTEEREENKKEKEGEEEEDEKNNGL